MNKPLSIIVVNPDIGKLVAENDGYCPCAIEHNSDTKCICRAFWEQDEPGECHCGRFEKVYVEKGERMNITIFDRLYPMDKQAEGMAVAAAAATGVCDTCEFFQECISNKLFVFPETAWCSKKKEEILDDLLNRRRDSRNEC